MSAIKPTTILPYTKTSPAPVISEQAKNVTASLTYTAPATNESIAELIGVLTAPAAYKNYSKTETNGHIGAVFSAWKKRKQ